MEIIKFVFFQEPCYKVAPSNWWNTSVEESRVTTLNTAGTDRARITLATLVKITKTAHVPRATENLQISSLLSLTLYEVVTHWEVLQDYMRVLRKCKENWFSIFLRWVYWKRCGCKFRFMNCRWNKNTWDTQCDNLILLQETGPCGGD